MYNRIKHIVTFFWPVIESLILATLIGFKYNNQLSMMVVIFIFMIVINYIYKHGYVVRILGWGIYGLLLGSTFYLLLNGILFVLFALIRYLLGVAYQKLAS